MNSLFNYQKPFVRENPLCDACRAALAETIETCDYTSAQRRVQSLQEQAKSLAGQAKTLVVDSSQATAPSRDCMLSPLSIDERNDPVGPNASVTGRRCSDKGFLAMSLAEYLELLDWAARQIVDGKRGATPHPSNSVTLSTDDKTEKKNYRLSRLPVPK